MRHFNRCSGPPTCSLVNCYLKENKMNTCLVEASGLAHKIMPPFGFCFQFLTTQEGYNLNQLNRQKENTNTLLSFVWTRNKHLGTFKLLRFGNYLLPTLAYLTLAQKTVTDVHTSGKSQVAITKNDTMYQRQSGQHRSLHKLFQCDYFQVSLDG